MNQRCSEDRRRYLLACISGRHDPDFVHRPDGARIAFYRLLMRLGLHYTIYDSDLVVIERPQGSDFVVDLLTGRVENAED